MQQIEIPASNEKAFQMEHFHLCDLFMVRMRGLEPPCLAALAPKTSVSTIPPHPRKWYPVILLGSSAKYYSRIELKVMALL